MKIDPSDPDVAERTAPKAADAAARRRPLLRRLGAVGAVLALVLVLAYALRHALIGLLLTRGLSLVTGDEVRIDAFRIGFTRSVFTGVRVRTRGGDPMLEADRIALQATLGSVLTDSVRCFGLARIDVVHPVISIVRHADGSYNLGSGSGGGSGSSAGGGPPRAPWNLDVQIRSGELRLIDRAAGAGDLAVQRVVAIDLDAQVRSDGRSMLGGHARVVARPRAAAADRDWPLTLAGTVDYPRGVAMVGLRARELPLRGAMGFLVHSGAVRVDDGVLHDLALSVFALDIAPQEPLKLHVGGEGVLEGGSLTVAALRRPIRDLHGRLNLEDNGVWSTRLVGRLAGIPLVARGGAYDRQHPTLRLALAADGDLRDLRRAFAFSTTQPVAGGFHLETLLEAPVANLLVRTELHVPHGSYGQIPLDGVSGRIDYHAGTVVLDGVRGRYGAMTVGLGARFLLGGPALDSAIVATGAAPGRALPYAENIAPEAMVDAVALITGAAPGYRARGSLGLGSADLSGSGVFAVDERGVGEFGPFRVTRSDGSSLIGALRLERPTSQSAAWISARNYRVNVPAAGARFSGLRVPAFPPLAGVIDGEIAGGGRPDEFALTGSLRGRGLRVGNAALGTGRATLGGTLRDLRLADVSVDGPLGRFAGSAAAGNARFALKGRYEGSLERLVPLTGDQQAHGAVRGDLLAWLSGPDVVVQSSDAVLTGGTVRGVTLERAAGTIAVRADRFHLLAGSGSIAGRRAVALESGGTIAVSAPDIPSRALRGTGLALDAGNVSAYGSADLRWGAPRFDGTVAVADGRARGYPVAGDAQIDLDGPRARVYTATGALGSTYGSIDGFVSGIGERGLRYDLNVRVPLGDIDLLRRDLDIPVPHLAGTFDARLHVHGTGTRPYVDGQGAAPEGSYNGLAFRSAAARLIIDPDGIAAHEGTVTVGGTSIGLDASRSGAAFGFTARSAAADLADFNDYFDASDTLAGRGSFDFAVRTYGQHIASRGTLAFDGVRYRAFPIGRATARWETRGTVVSGHAGADSAAGAFAGRLTVEPARGSDPLAALRFGRYDAQATVARLDLGTWVPASGSSAPILGRVDARIGIGGRMPRLTVDADATLTQGSIRGFAVPRAHLRARASGTRIAVAASDADLGFAQLSASGQLGLAKSDPLAFDLRVSTADAAGAIRAFVPAARGLDLAGALDADIRLSGTFGRPTVQGGFDVRNARYGGFVVPRTIGDLALAGNAVELRDADIEFSRGQAFVAGSLPLVLTPFGLGPPRAPLSFDVTARSVDLAQFAPLLPTGTVLGGVVDGRFGVEGTVDRPRLLGALAVSGGSYASPFERAPILGVDARLAFDGGTIALRAFHAGVGGGTLDGSGRITLPIAGRPGVAYTAAVTAKAAKLDFPAYGRGTLDGDLTLAGSGNSRPLVGGDLALRDAVVPVSAVYGSNSAATGAAVGGPAIDPAFHLHAVAGDNVRIRSSIVDIGVTGAVDVGGTLRAPTLAGGFTATNGTISSYNHVFRIVNATVSFNPADGATPTIAARAISRVTNPDPDPSRNIAGSATIIVTVSGTADSNNLAVTYSSEPAYSQEQIIGLLLDVPALLGAVNFNLNGGSGGPLLRGAPGETNALLPPGVTPEQVSAISFNQEVFSLLNGQFTQRALTPVERVFEKTLGLSDVQFTVDYGGGIGYSLRRQVGKRDFYAFLSQTVTYPERANIGFELVPRPYETVNFSIYEQNGVTSLITNQTPGEFFLNSTRRLTSVQPLGNRSGVSVNLSRRF